MIEKNFFQIWSWMPRICKNDEVTRTIFWKTGYFLTCYWRFQSDLKHPTIKMPIGTDNWNVGRWTNQKNSFFTWLSSVKNKITNQVTLDIHSLSPNARRSSLNIGNGNVRDVFLKFFDSEADEGWADLLFKRIIILF